MGSKIYRGAGNGEVCLDHRRDNIKDFFRFNGVFKGTHGLQRSEKFPQSLFKFDLNTLRGILTTSLGAEANIDSVIFGKESQLISDK